MNYLEAPFLILAANVLAQLLLTIRPQALLFKIGQWLNLLAFGASSAEFFWGQAKSGWAPAGVLDQNEFTFLLCGVTTLFFFVAQAGATLTSNDNRTFPAPEAPLIRAGFVFACALLAGSRHSAAVMILAPTIAFLGFFHPRLRTRTISRHNLSAAWTVASLALLVLGLSAALLAISGVGLRFDGRMILTPNFNWSMLASLGLLLYCIGIAFLILIPLSPLDLESAETAADWEGLSFFRLGTSFVGMIHFLNILGTDKFIGAHVAGGSKILSEIAGPVGLCTVGVFCVWLLSRLLSSKRPIVLIVVISAQPFLMSIFAALHQSDELYRAALLGALFSAIAVPLLWMTLRESDVLGAPDIYNLGARSKKMSHSLRLRTFLAFFVVAPFGSYFGVTTLVAHLTDKSWDHPHSILTLAFVGVALGANALFLGQFFERPDQSSTDHGENRITQVANISLLFAVLLVGIYPTPLYKYIVETTRGIFS